MHKMNRAPARVYLGQVQVRCVVGGDDSLNVIKRKLGRLFRPELVPGRNKIGVSSRDPVAALRGAPVSRSPEPEPQNLNPD